MFGEASFSGAMKLKNILKEYERGSRQCVNFHKSSLLQFQYKTGCEVANFEYFGCSISTSSEKYLRLPNLVGRGKKQSFQILKDRIANRIDSWSSRVLSQGGKEVFMKLVL